MILLFPKWNQNATEKPRENDTHAQGEHQGHEIHNFSLIVFSAGNYVRWEEFINAYNCLKQECDHHEHDDWLDSSVSFNLMNLRLLVSSNNHHVSWAHE